MRRISILGRSLGQAISAQPSGYVCQSCRLTGTNFQRRQFRHISSTQQEAKKTLPKSPQEDPNYIEATTWDGLERVGSDMWVEDQFDPYDNYQGWTSLAKKKKFTVEEADDALFPIVNEVLAGQGEASGQLSAGRGEWLSYRPSDPAVKLGIAKLLLQRTGVKISDFDLYRASSLKDIRQALLMKPESKKLAQDLKDVEGIKELANIKIHARRVTPIDKEKAVGRWKIIEQELINRGLPVTGHSGRRRNEKVEEE